MKRPVRCKEFSIKSRVRVSNVRWSTKEAASVFEAAASDFYREVRAMIGLLKDGPFDGQRISQLREETLSRWLHRAGQHFRYVDMGAIDLATGYRIFVYLPLQRRIAR